MTHIEFVIYVIVGLGAFAVGYLVRRYIAESKIKNAESEAKRIIEDAEKQGETTKKEILLEAKEEVHKHRTELEREIRDRRGEIQRIERRLLQREETLDRKVETLEQREEVMSRKQKEIQKAYDDVQELYKKQLEELERLSGLSSEEAKQLLLNDTEKQVRHEAAIMIKDIENKAKEEASNWRLNHGERRPRYSGGAPGGTGVSRAGGISQNSSRAMGRDFNLPALANLHQLRLSISRPPVQRMPLAGFRRF